MYSSIPECTTVRGFALEPDMNLNVVRARVHAALCITKLAAHVAEPANDMPLCLAKCERRRRCATRSSPGPDPQLTKCTFAHVSKARSCALLRPADAGVYILAHGSKPAILRMLLHIAELRIKAVNAPSDGALKLSGAGGPELTLRLRAPGSAAPDLVSYALKVSSPQRFDI